MTNQELINRTVAYVKETLQQSEAGHDWFHVERVWKLSLVIASDYPCNLTAVELGSLLHDIADAKFHNGDEDLGPERALQFLKVNQVEEQTINLVIDIIRNISYKNRAEAPSIKSIELQIVQDADRLDALGAIGIARTFHFGGFRNNPIYDPKQPPNLNQSKEVYKQYNGTTINHFYEKLLLLKDLMNTNKGREIAQKRHNYMLRFLEQFYAEWHGEA